MIKTLTKTNAPITPRVHPTPRGRVSLAHGGGNIGAAFRRG